MASWRVNRRKSFAAPSDISGLRRGLGSCKMPGSLVISGCVCFFAAGEAARPPDTVSVSWPISSAGLGCTLFVLRLRSGTLPLLLPAVELLLFVPL
jgi:hypothetical protein